MQGVNWDNCLTAMMKGMSHCSSSDTMVGWCMGRHNLTCTPALIQGQPNKASSVLPAKGLSRFFDKRGDAVESHSLICQDPTHHGGVSDVDNLGQIWRFNQRDYKNCAVLHPMKRPEHFRFARMAMTEAIETYLFDNNHNNNNDNAGCHVAVGVFSSSSRTAQRNAIRRTWGKVAKSVGSVFIRFLVGHGNSLPPSAKQSLSDELGKEDDMVLLSGNQTKTSGIADWLRWAKSNTQCKIIFKVDDDVYVRILPLLNLLFYDQDSWSKLVISEPFPESLPR